MVWQSYGSSGSDPSGYSVQGQRYTSDGSIAGSEFQVNTYTTGGQRFPSVGLDADGDFVVCVGKRWLERYGLLELQRPGPALCFRWIHRR